MSDKIDIQNLVDLPLKRIIGEYPAQEEDLRPGPVLLVSGGVHGNEPSGIIALQRVFKKLEEYNIPLKGGILGISGNLAALKKGVRMIDRDLNRICSPENELRIKNQDTLDISEEYEFQALIKIKELLGLNENFEQLFFIDLHTTSSNTIPYISVNRKSRSFAFAKKFPLPVVSGIEKYIPGHFDHYLTLKGHTGITVEAGHHDSPDSIEYHESTVWNALVISGMVEEKEIPNYREYVDKLRFSSDDQQNFEVIFKYQICPDEVFKMKSGFFNFSKISKGQLLAWSDGEPIYSEWDDYIFLPLYQSQGSDGFFIIRTLQS